MMFHYLDMILIPVELVDLEDISRLFFMFGCRLLHLLGYRDIVMVGVILLISVLIYIESLIAVIM